MKRTVISFIIIIVSIFAVVLSNIFIIEGYEKNIIEILDEITSEKEQVEQLIKAKELWSFYEEKEGVIRAFVPSDRVDEFEYQYKKLLAYMAESEPKETAASIAELRVRVANFNTIW